MVWAHEYVNPLPPDKLGSFASSTHNHRYCLVSRIVSGSITATYFDFARDSNGQLERVNTVQFVAGDTYHMVNSEIHRLDKVSPSTLTLVIQSPSVTEQSMVYDWKTGRFVQVDGESDPRENRASLEEAHSRFIKKLELLSKS